MLTWLAEVAFRGSGLNRIPVLSWPHADPSRFTMSSLGLLVPPRSQLTAGDCHLFGQEVWARRRRRREKNKKIPGYSAEEEFQETFYYPDL